MIFQVLRTFDEMVVDAVKDEIEGMGINLEKNSQVTNVEKKSNGLLKVIVFDIFQ